MSAAEKFSELVRAQLGMGGPTPEKLDRLMELEVENARLKARQELRLHDRPLTPTEAVVEGLREAATREG